MPPTPQYVNKIPLSKFLGHDTLLVMKRIFALITLFLSLTLPAWAANTFYFSFLPDLPVAPNLSEDANTAVSFDQPEGRIIVLQASGKSSLADVKSFYSKTLPALGWNLNSSGRYIRDGEAMILDLNTQPNGSTKVHILVRPE